MKKITALLVALAAAVCFMSTALTTSAENVLNTVTTTTTDTSSTFTTGGSLPIDVKGEFTAAAQNTVVSVVVSWEQMSFKYSVAGDGIWNPEDHTFSGGISEDGWSTTKKYIKIVNHSDTIVNAEFDFTASTGLTLQGKFYTKSQNAQQQDVYTEFTGKHYLDSAIGTTYDTAPSSTVYLGIQGGGITQAQKLGTVTVTIASEYLVSDEAGLKNAINNGAEAILLTNDITLSEPLTIQGKGSSAKRIIIHTLDPKKEIKGQLIVDNSHVEFANVDITYKSFGTPTTSSPTSPDGLAIIRAKNSSSIQFENVDIGKASSTDNVFTILAQESDLSFNGINKLNVSYTYNSNPYVFFIKDGTAKFNSDSNTTITTGKIVISGTAQLIFDRIQDFKVNGGTSIRNTFASNGTTILNTDNVNNNSDWIIVYTPTNP